MIPHLLVCGRNMNEMPNEIATASRTSTGRHAEGHSNTPHSETNGIKDYSKERALKGWHRS